VEWLAENAGKAAAQKWYEGFEGAVASLVEMPLRCPRAREADAFPDVDLRQLLYQSHRLIFAVIGDEVHVLHVRHMARPGLDKLD